MIMWISILLSLSLLLALTECTKTLKVRTLAASELGPAASCEWQHYDPYDCVYDPNRGTIDLDYLTDILTQLQQYKEDELNRRKL